MAEQTIRIQGADKNGIYGVLASDKNKRLVIHLHGMTHQTGYLLEVTSSEFFEAHHFDHYRISFYNIMKDSRKLHQSTLSTHVRDLQSVIDHFKGSYDEIFITAHSLSALVVMILNPADVKGLSLWDPSLDVSSFWKVADCLTPHPDGLHQVMDYGNSFLISNEMVEEIAAYPDASCQKLAQNITTPTQFIIPDESIFLASPHTSPESYHHCFAGSFDLCRIKDADHRFSYRGNREALFQNTLHFFETL